MNIINDYLNFYNKRKELMVIQESNDKKLLNLFCKDVVVFFLLFERNNTREQINNASKYSIWNMGPYMNDVHQRNKQNLDFLQKILETNDSKLICNTLKKINKLKPIFYSDINNK